MQKVNIGEIELNPENPRIITDEKLKQLKQSIDDFPQMLEIRPIVVDDDMVVLGGNMRLIACQKLGIKKINIIKASGLTAKQKKEFVVKDNLSFGDWDFDALLNWDQELLLEWGMDVNFGSPKTGGFIDDDFIPAEPEITISKKGDIWLLGEHRLMCGDATDHKDVKLLTNGELANLVWTDPPYNVDVTGVAGKIINDNMSHDNFKEFLKKSYENYHRNMQDGAVIYVAHSDTERVNFTQEFLNADFKLSQNLIWKKNSATFSRQDYNWQHESILYGWKKGAGHYFSKDFTQTTVFDQDKIEFKNIKKAELVEMLESIYEITQSTVIEHDRPTVSELHPTMKPIALVQKFIENSSKEKDLVLDLFAGAGSTLIASINSNRKCYLMELDPKFVDVIINRWQMFTKNKATHETTGASFD